MLRKGQTMTQKLTPLEDELLEALQNMVNTNWKGKGPQCRKSQNEAIAEAKKTIAKTTGGTQ